MARSDLQDHDTPQKTPQHRGFEPPEPVNEGPVSRKQLESSEPVASAKDKSEAAESSKEKTETSEQASKTSDKTGLASRAVGFAGRHKKGGLIGGGILASVFAIALASFFLFLPLKLIHIRENLSRYFDKRTNHAISLRAPQGYRVAFDKDGKPNGFEQHDLAHPLRSKLYNYRSNKLFGELETKGIKATFDQNNHFTGFDVTENGGASHLGTNEALGLSEGRSLVRSEIVKANPEMGFFRRSIRARKMYRKLNITLSFFTLQDRIATKSADLAKQVVKKLRDKVAGVDSTRIRGDVPDESKNAKTDAEKADAEKQTAFGTDATTEIQTDVDATNSAYTNGDPIPESVGISKQLGDDISTVKGSFGFRSLGAATSFVSLACSFEGLAKGIREGAALIRALPLIRWAMTLMTIADTTKNGKLTGANNKELGEVMRKLGNSSSDFSQSGGWQTINTGKKVKSKYASSFSTHFDGESSLVTFENGLKRVVGTPGGTTCKVAGNVFVQYADSITEVAVGIFSGETSTAVSTALTEAAKAAIAFGIGEASGNIIDRLMPDLTKLAAGKVLTFDEPPEALGDAAVSGYELTSNFTAKNNGAPKVDNVTAGNIDRQIAQEEAQDPSLRSAHWRIFALDNPRSLVMRALTSFPSSGAQLKQMAVGFLRFIDPTDMQSKLAFAGSMSHFITPSAYAADIADNVAYPNLYGNDQYAFTDTQLQKYDMLQNESYIVDNPKVKESYDKFSSKCLDISNSNSALNLSNFITGNDSYCNQDSGDYERFRIYWFDQGIGNMIDSYSNDNDDQNVQLATDSAASSAAPCIDGGQAVVGNPRIVCEAIKYDPYGYLFAAGHEDAASWKAKFTACQPNPATPKHPGNPNCGLNFEEGIVDCSGLINITLFDSFGIKDMRDSDGYGSRDPNFRKLGSIAEVLPGDMLIRSGSGKNGHISIVVSKSGDTIEAFSASSHNAPIADQIRYATIPNLGKGRFDYAIRYIGPGATYQ